MTIEQLIDKYLPELDANPRTFYVYEIPGVKIGCTTQPKARVNRQGYSTWIILEEHQDIFVASDRERELQALHGYKVDKHPYYLSYFNRLETLPNLIEAALQAKSYMKASKASVESGAATRNLTNWQKTHKEEAHALSVRNGKINAAKMKETNYGHFGRMGTKGGAAGGKINANIVRLCPYCGRETRGPSHFQHIEKCKHKHAEN